MNIVDRTGVFYGHSFFLDGIIGFMFLCENGAVKRGGIRKSFLTPPPS